MANHQEDSQQRQALEHFRVVAEEWQKKALGDLRDRVNITAQRNAAVIRIKNRRGNVRRFLDIGCGSGELVLELAAAGIKAVGIDYAPEMIALGEERKRERQIENAVFLLQSVFDYQPPAEPFDLVSALGFIEYISRGELDRFLEQCHGLLCAGGSLVLGSRNRLFNLFSLNDFTLQELELGVTDSLLREAVALASGGDPAAVLDAALAVGREYPQPDSHPETSGIKVKSRYQYTPGELALILKAHGFKARTLFPVHYHAVPPGAKEVYKDLYLVSANLLHDFGPEDPRLIPYSSSFVLEAERL